MICTSTARQPLDRDHVLYLTVNVEAYRQHPGDYVGAQAFVQLTGPISVESWSNHAFPVHVNPDHSIVLPSVDLAADPGTGSSGTVTVAGPARCAPS